MSEAHAEREPDLLTVPEVAEILRADESTVRRWVAEGRLAAARVGGKILIGRPSIEAILAEATRPAMVAPLAHTMSAPYRNPRSGR